MQQIFVLLINHTAVTETLFAINRQIKSLFYSYFPKLDRPYVTG